MGNKQVFFILLLFFSGIFMHAQNKYEQEHRILKKQFPEKALTTITKKLEDARHIRYYKEIDSTKINYKVKFKKDRLRYSVNYDKQGVLENIGIIIKPIDIPTGSFTKIEAYLTAEFNKYRIKKIHQQYPVSTDEDAEITIKNAFQNLILPEINYVLIVVGKKGKTHQEYEFFFNAEGDLIKLRKTLPPNYDHILY